MNLEKVEAVYCPGWTGIDGQRHACGGRDSNRNLLKAGDNPPCQRCRKQKAKWDETHGLREREAAAAKERKQALARLYAADLGITLGPSERALLVRLIDNAEQLEGRWHYPPHDHSSSHFGGGFNRYRDKTSVQDWWAALRVLAGLDGEAD